MAHAGTSSVAGISDFTVHGCVAAEDVVPEAAAPMIHSIPGPTPEVRHLADTFRTDRNYQNAIQGAGQDQTLPGASTPSTNIKCIDRQTAAMAATSHGRGGTTPVANSQSHTPQVQPMDDVRLRESTIKRTATQADCDMEYRYNHITGVLELCAIDRDKTTISFPNSAHSDYGPAGGSRPMSPVLIRTYQYEVRWKFYLRWPHVFMEVITAGYK